MTTTIIQIGYFTLLLLYISTDIFLEFINIRHSKAHQSQIPPFMKDILSISEYRDSITYTIAKSRMNIATCLFEGVLLTVIILSGFLGSFDSFISTIAGNGIPAKTLYVLGIGFLFYLLHIPVQLYGQFIIERRYGFSTITPKLWLKDQVKTTLLSMIIGLLLLSGLFWFMNTAGGLWWMYAYLSFVLIQLFLMFLYPVVIAPLFNKFEPMEENPLKTRLLALTEKLNFPVKGLFVMDGSKRSRHSNAYFTGIGSAKRIVLFDTLIDQMNPDELESVLAHEIGHFKKKHILKSMIFSFILVFIGFISIALLRGYEPLFTSFGAQSANDHILIIILLYFSTPFSFLLTPLFSYLSRKNEYEADKYAAEALGSPEHLIEGLKKLAAKNLSNLMPHKAYSTFHYSHPALNERIESLSKADT